MSAAVAATRKLHDSWRALVRNEREARKWFHFRRCYSNCVSLLRNCRFRRKMLTGLRATLITVCAMLMTSNALHQKRFGFTRMQETILRSTSSTSYSGKSVGFIGLGLMGNGMARRLLLDQCPLAIWNRSKAKCEDLKRDYDQLVYIADSPADVVGRSDITFVMLSTPEASKSVYAGSSGMLSALSLGKGIIDCATLTPGDMEWASQQVRERGGTFLEGPVSGSKVPAEKGQLIFLLSGDQALAEEVKPHLAQMGKASHFIGVEAGSATKMKLIVNAILSNMLACLGEGLSMTSDCGLSPAVLVDVLMQGAVASPLIALKGPVHLFIPSNYYCLRQIILTPEVSYKISIIK